MKKNSLKQTVTLALLVGAATWLLTGCGTTAGYKKADKTGADIAQFREDIVRAKTSVDNTVKSLNEIAVTADTNPRKAYEQFSENVNRLEADSARAKKSGTDMKAQGQAYFAQWEKQLAEIQNPQIKKLAEQQKNKLRQTFSSIQSYTEPLKAQFDPWLSDLKDLQKYLGNDLTIAGVDAAKGLFAKTRSEGYEVQKSMDSLVAELNTIAATLTPADAKKK